MINFKELVRLGKDAETRHTQAGKAVTGFSAAFDNGWGDSKKTEWLDCSIWGDRGSKLSEHLTKGSQVVVEGNIGTREHDGKTYLTLNVSDLKLVGGKPVSESRPSTRSASRVPAHHADASNGDLPPDDDIPFSPRSKRSHI